MMRVDFPRPDSPVDRSSPAGQVRGQPRSLEDPHQAPLQNPQTCHHECEVKPLLDRLAMQLVGEGGKPHILLVLLVRVDDMRLLGAAGGVPQYDLISEARRSQPTVG